MTRTTTGLAAAAVAGLLVIAPSSVALAAGHGHGHTKTHDAKQHGKPAPKKFTATGHVVSVDGDQLTLDDKGGSRDLHGTTVVVTVPDDAKVNRDDESADTSELQAGDHVMVNGKRTADGLVARHVNADSTADSAGAEDADDDTTVDDGTTDDSTTADDGTVTEDGTGGDASTDDAGATA